MPFLRSRCALLSLLLLLAPPAVRAQDAALDAVAEPPVQADTRRQVKDGLLGGLVGGLVGGLAGAGLGVVLDLQRCMLWCQPQPSQVPRTTLVGVSVGGLLGVLLSTSSTAPDARAAESLPAARLERIHFDPRGRSIGLSGLF